jgi:hypothetical protein
MVGGDTTRRRFLVAAITYSGLLSSGIGMSVLRTSEAWARSSGQGADGMLGHFARLLYPHDALADETYIEVISAILEAAASDSSLDGVIEETISALNSSQDGDWFELDEETQIAVMESRQDDAFFAAIQFQVMARFYNHPKVWQVIGYPGSAKEYGGYLERGFDDIDWLPEEA